jgi:pyruvate/2-oxoglutarate dehydrogenase complex dihydrolipoamide dehydrogenase (E3) component
LPDTKHYDLIVFGGGNAISTAIQCGAKGMQVALVEKGPLRPYLSAWGCIPSKLLIDEPIDYGPMPHTIFTSPEIAGVGPLRKS